MAKENGVRPITPDEVASVKENILPDAMIEAFNEMIARRWSGGKSKFASHEIVSLMKEKGLSDDDISNNRWRGVLDVFEKHGWDVETDTPSWDENGEETLTFRRKK